MCNLPAPQLRARTIEIQTPAVAASPVPNLKTSPLSVLGCDITDTYDGCCSV